MNGDKNAHFLRFGGISRCADLRGCPHPKNVGAHGTNDDEIIMIKKFFSSFLLSFLYATDFFHYVRDVMTR